MNSSGHHVSRLLRFAIAIGAAASFVACSGDDDGDDDTSVDRDGGSVARDAGQDDRDAGTRDAGETPQPATCDDYCAAVMASCTGANELYADMNACMTACAVIPTGGNAGDTDGNTLNCRTYHAGAAAMDAALHCPHASINGGGVCGDYCEVYCGFATTNCTAGPEVSPHMTPKISRKTRCA